MALFAPFLLRDLSKECLLFKESAVQQKIKNKFCEYKVLLRAIPSPVVTLFIMSVFAMNLLANKSVNLPFEWLALDCGIIVSWFAFLTMDIVTKHFGPKAATQLSFFAIAMNLLFCLIFFLGSKIPGTWGESYVEGSEDIINTALDNTFGGTWYVLFGSTIAFAISAAINNFTNWGIGKTFKKNPDGAAAYVLRTYVSTALGQFVDNIVFALLVSHFFFGWSLMQCITCALTGMIVELLFEIVFSYLGFAVCKRWKRDEVGKEYFAYMNEKRQ